MSSATWKRDDSLNFSSVVFSCWISFFSSSFSFLDASFSVCGSTLILVRRIGVRRVIPEIELFLLLFWVWKEEGDGSLFICVLFYLPV